MPNIGGRYRMRNGKRELVARTQETAPKPPQGQASSKASTKPAAAETQQLKEKGDA